ncbi:MAG: peptide-methionine (S)-S-oxide reductase MsrA [Porticoccaceae bacterium]|jgi:peptide-methionine (S)-S-oxide reductase
MITMKQPTLSLLALPLLTLLFSWYGLAAENSAQPKATAYFAGGCFWCMEPPFDKEPGVIATTSGYMGGFVDNPDYRQVSAGNTGHAEVVRVTYNPEMVSYTRLLDIFWRNIDPTDAGGQFCDRGNQYRSEIFVIDETQQQLAQASRAAIAEGALKSQKIITAITPAGTFYAAENYHQDYYQRNPVRYKYYRFRCGRDDRLEDLWGRN